MLPIILVLLVATSALAAPQAVQLTQYGQNDIRGRDNSLIGSALEVVDGGDVSVYGANLLAVLKDVGRNPALQPQVLGQALAILGELSAGRPGDSCAASSLINSYVNYAGNGNAGPVRQALGNYIQQVINKIDHIVSYVANPESVRYAAGPQGRCAGEGRSYQFDKAWDTILGSASPNQIGSINEEYCIAKRLYCAFNARTNNIGAHVTATALPVTVQVMQPAQQAISTFLSSIAANRNAAQAGAAVKQALIGGLRRVSL